MEGWLLAYQLPSGLKPKDRTRFHDAFWGRVTKTWKGLYEFHKAGLMEGIPHRRLIRGVFIVRSADVDRVKDFLREWKAEVHVRRVRLDRGDVARLEG